MSLTFKGETSIQLFLGLHMSLQLPSVNALCLHVVGVGSGLLVGHDILVIDGHATADFISGSLLRS